MLPMGLLGSLSTRAGASTTGSNLLRPPAAASTRSAAAVTSSGRTASWEARYAAPEPTAAAQLTSPEVPSALPNLQPISRMLDRQLQREQQQRKRLRKQLQRLERQLYNRTSSSSSDQAEFLEPFSSPRQADSDDPLFSTARPPSVQQLQRLVVHRRTQLLRATSSSISDVTRVAEQLQDIASHLGLHLNLVIPLVARHEPLLLQPAHQLPPRLSLLASALQLTPQEAAELLSSSAPQLLGTPLVRLQSNLVQLGRVLSSRGLNPAEILQARLDLLTQKPSSVESKLEQLPGGLGMSRQRVRQLVSQCPDLLRCSVATISHRYHSLRQLFNIPDSFVEEFVVQEPELLCMSASTLKAKFNSLIRRYGAFADDVLDMVLVDPALLINADPAAAPPAPAVKASRKKQQRLLQEQQQQQQQQQQQLGQQEQLQQGSQTGASAADSTTAVAASTSVEQAGLQQAVDAANVSNAEVEQQPHEQSQSAAAAAAAADLQGQQQPHAAEEPWQAVLRMRLERRQAAKELRRLQLQQERQQLEQQLRLREAPSHQQQQQRVVMRSRGGSSRQSPVRRLLGFAGATGLSPEQALELWQQEPSLSQLPAAAVARQVAELSQALGLLDGPTSSSGSSDNKMLAAIAADKQQQQLWSMGPSAGSDMDSSSSSSGFSRPVLQVLVKEPLLLALSQEQLAENMQGLCDLLGLQAAAAGAGSWQQGLQQPGSLLPLLWEQPGLLLLPPEVAEYRLQHLAGLLQLSVPRTLQLVLQQPQLLTERPVLLAARLGSLCTMLGVARGVASECVLREPRVLCVEEGELQGRWDALVGRFGWAPDALDVVMADPAALMRDSLDE